MRHLILTTICMSLIAPSVAADGGCDADIVTYLQQTARAGAETEINTRRIKEVPTAREVSCLGDIMSRNVGIWVSFPNFANIGGEMAKRGCKAVREAIDGVLDAGNIRVKLPNVAIPGDISRNFPQTNRVPQTLSPNLLEALDDLRNGGNP